MAGEKIYLNDVDGVGLSTLNLTKINSPSMSQLSDLLNSLLSAGLISGGAMSNNGDGTITVAAGEGCIKSTDADTGVVYACKWAENTSVALTNNSVNYVYLAYVSTIADPIVTVSTTRPTDLNRNILIGSVYRSGVENHLTSATKYDIANNMRRLLDRLTATEYFIHAAGAVLSETGTRNIACTEGEFWEGLNQISTIAQDTSGSSPDDNHTFEYFYYNGSAWVTHEATIAAAAFTGSGLDDGTSGGTFVGSHTIRIHVEITATGANDTYKWSYKGNDGVTVIETTGVVMSAGADNLVDGATITFAAVTGHTIGDAWDFDCILSSQIDNTQYNNTASGLATLSNNQYGVHWIYTDVHGHMAVLFGQASYTLANAQDAQPPVVLPDEFETHSRLIGKVIIKKSAAAFTSIENNYGQTFQGTIPPALLGDKWKRMFYTYNMVTAGGYTWNGASNIVAPGASILNERYRFQAFSGTGTTEEGSYLNFILPADYTAGSDIKVTLNSTSNVAGNNYRFYMGLTQPDSSDQFSNDSDSEFIGITEATSLGWEIRKSVFTFDGTNMSPGDPISIMLYRDAGDAADTETGDVYANTLIIEEV